MCVMVLAQGPPVSGAHVTLGKDHMTTTDEEGHYQLLNVTTGTYSLKVRVHMHFVTCNLFFTLAS